MASDNAAPKKRTFSWKQARLLISVFLLVFFFLIGRGIGKTTGDLIGKAAGSYDGVMRANDAMEAGAEAGLSAEDIETTLVHTFTQAGRLQFSRLIPTAIILWCWAKMNDGQPRAW